MSRGRRPVIVLVSVLLAVVLLTPAGAWLRTASAEVQHPSGPYGKYDPPIEVTIGMNNNDGITG